MKMKTRTAGALVALSAFVMPMLTGGAAQATHQCVTVSGYAPVGSPQSQRVCAPAPLPPQFADAFWFQDCERSPAFGFELCVTYDGHLFLP